MLLGHLDTVWPVGTLAKMPWRAAEGKIFGPGVLDMKAGVVMALEAVRVMRALGAERPVTLLLNSDEEVGSTVSEPSRRGWRGSVRRCSSWNRRRVWRTKRRAKASVDMYFG